MSTKMQEIWSLQSSLEGWGTGWTVIARERTSERAKHHPAEKAQRSATTTSPRAAC